MISIIIPFYNEEDNLKPLYEELEHALKKQKEEYEIILVDDGSTDRSMEEAPGLAEKNKHVVYSRLRKRSGKGAALANGIGRAKGSILVFMDADLQDDPANIQDFVEKLEEGYDLVNGIRKKRKDGFLVRLYSSLANNTLRLLLRSPFADINCGFKAFRKEILQEITFYGNNFRFFPLAAYMHGYKVAQVPVNNRPRMHGKSKFGSRKLLIGIFDTLTAYFLFKFSERPLHFFGLFGGIFFLTGFGTALYLSYERLFKGVLLFRRPALLFAVLLIIVGIQIIMTGIVGELIVYLHKKRETD